MSLSEADTKAKLIDPALHRRGWTEDLIRREETERGIDIIDGKPRRRERGRIDYILRVRVNISTQPFALALIEAKRSDEPPDKGLEQAKKYARLNHVPFVYSSNGHLFVGYDHFKGITSEPRPLEEFPTPYDLRQRYENRSGVSLESEKAKPLLIQYSGGEASRRYYQDAAIRAALEKIARGDKRLLLFLATGSGKTFIAVHLLKKIADAGQLRRALFVCDRDELRTQGLGALMMGRGSRIHLPTNKLMFRVYDYTNATRLLGKGFVSRPSPTREPKEHEETRKEKMIRVEGFDVHVNPCGTYILTKIEDKLGMVTVEEYKQMIAYHLTKEAKMLDDFRNVWIDPQKPRRLVGLLPDDGQGLRLLHELLNRKDCDFYDLLAEIGYGIAPKNRAERVDALQYKHKDWFKGLPKKTRDTLLAIAKQFEKGGIEELENPYVFNTPDVVKAGGIESLKILGEPKDIINETKKRLFAA